MKIFRLAAVWLLLLSLAAGFPHSTQARVSPPAPTPLAPDLLRVMAASGPANLIAAIITLEDAQAGSRVLPIRGAQQRAAQVERELQARASSSQARLLAFLEPYRREGRMRLVRSFWIFNGIQVLADAGTLAEIAAQPGVVSITPDRLIPGPQILQPAAMDSSPAYPNLALIHAPDLWNLGYTGQGIVVANVDSGVDASHPGLSTQYRGGSNSWFDAFGEYATPTDPVGHGTQTMGILVGRDANGDPTGVAPDAHWIAARIFNNQNIATTAGVHAAYQWILDPDGDPTTPDAPDVVSSSWNITNPGCILEFEPDVKALAAAGIVPVFAAGNQGSVPLASRSPANYPDAFSVGAVNNLDQGYFLSSSGPSPCGVQTFPQVVAPGVDIYTTDFNQQYSGTNTGTSFSAPHVAGSLALLLSAFPRLSTAEQENSLRLTAVELGDPGADSVYGYGRIDLLAAYNWLGALRHTYFPLVVR